MRYRSHRFAKRVGAITPLAALLCAFLLGMVAFAVDTSWIVLTRSELQNAADSAALAGAGQLMTGYVQYNLPNQTSGQKTALINSAITKAKAAATQYAAYHTAGGVANLALNDADIQVGLLDATGTFTPSAGSGPYPNTVRVLMRRDGQANQSLRLFFAPVLGIATMDVNAPASATCYAGTISGFSTASGLNASLLPVTYDVNNWNAFLKTGLNPDGLSMVDGSGNPEIQVYPSIKNSGNFGELSLNDSHNGASTTANWIANGAAPSDIQVLSDNNLIPLSNHPANTWDWQGNPGFKASNVAEINAQAGKTYLLPLFQPVSSDPLNYQAGVGQGANFSYDIVQFVAVTIMPVTDSNRQVVVQPAAYIAPTAYFAPGSVVPMGTETNPWQTTTFAAPKLSS